ncbi:thioredoxin family protein [Gabonibacter chumensis]|uniref:thioredoxin family protein n=1 Tax=Gabonibacter chumensis TaxID=2972474 RepID=UPI002572FCD3|nr:thioredoxin family protein [Gabonibacter chumensis]MCR9011539.1 thioredoxin family protein [Gabonibacter chumensis]
MKKNILLSILMLYAALAFGQGVKFEKLNFKEALSKAKTEKKYLFIDCYTTWCGPCKQMREQILTQPAAGHYFNPKFICVEYDMEKEGRELRKKFDVKAFPTYLIVNPDGTLYHKLVGSSFTADDFVAKVKKGMIKENSFGYQEKLHATGKMNNEQLKEYYFLLKETAERSRSMEIVKELTARLTSEEKMQAGYWFLFENQKYGDDGFLFVLKNLDTLKKNVGELEIGLYLNRCYSGILNTYISALSDNKFIDTPNTIDTLNKLRSQLSAVSLKNETALLEQIAFIEAALQDDTKEMLRAIELMVTSKQGNLWILPQILRIVREKKDKTLSSGVKAMKEKILSMLSTRTDKEKFEQLIDDIDK